MKSWEQFLKDWVNLVTWLGAFYGLGWKALDFLEKRAKERSLGAEKIKAYDKRFDEMEKICEASDKNLKKQDEEMSSLKTLVKEMGNRMWDFLKNKHE